MWNRLWLDSNLYYLLFPFWDYLQPNQKYFLKTLNSLYDEI